MTARKNRRRQPPSRLGNENAGIPDEALEPGDQFAQIPMIGVGLSLNLAVAGSLVAYRLAGLA